MTLTLLSVAFFVASLVSGAEDASFTGALLLTSFTFLTGLLAHRILVGAPRSKTVRGS